MTLLFLRLLLLKKCQLNVKTLLIYIKYILLLLSMERHIHTLHSMTNGQFDICAYCFQRADKWIESQTEETNGRRNDRPNEGETRARTQDAANEPRNNYLLLPDWMRCRIQPAGPICVQWKWMHWLKSAIPFRPLNDNCIMQSFVN